jgi:hypothetical protein
MRAPSIWIYHAYAVLIAAVVDVQYHPLNTLTKGCPSGKAGILV